MENNDYDTVEQLFALLPHSKGLNLPAGLSVWSVHALPALPWVFAVCFLPQSKDIHVTATSAVMVSLCLCWPCDGLATWLGHTLGLAQRQLGHAPATPNNPGLSEWLRKQTDVINHYKIINGLMTEWFNLCRPRNSHHSFFSVTHWVP